MTIVYILCGSMVLVINCNYYDVGFMSNVQLLLQCEVGIASHDQVVFVAVWCGVVYRRPSPALHEVPSAVVLLCQANRPPAHVLQGGGNGQEDSRRNHH